MSFFGRKKKNQNKTADENDIIEQKILNEEKKDMMVQRKDSKGG